MLYNALSVRKKTPKTAPSPWDFVNSARGGPSYGHRQYAQKLGKDRARGSGDNLADRQIHRHTHTDVLITILRNRFREVMINL